MPDDSLSRDLALGVVAKPLVTFYRMVDTGLAPQAADRSAGGLLPTRAFRYCKAVTTASAFGWYVFPPIAFSLLWDGTCVHWSCDGEQTWLLLQHAQFPDFAGRFDALAPEEARGFPPPFLGVLPEPGVVQVWSGLLARTLPEWSLLLRAPANIPKQGHYDLFEGIVETDRWFGPLFTNVRLTKTDVPVRSIRTCRCFRFSHCRDPFICDRASGISSASTGSMRSGQRIGAISDKRLWRRRPIIRRGIIPTPFGFVGAGSATKIRGHPDDVASCIISSNMTPRS